MLALATVLAGTTAITAACQQQAETGMVPEAKIKAEIAAQLPKHTPASAVEAWLATKGFAHSGLIDNASLAHMGFDPETYEIKALIHGPSKPALVRTDIQLIFIFDREHRLIETRVTPVHTGP
ncbi:MAG: hypothetical protein P8Y58_05335 [Novosphingobium sp.]